MMEYAFIVLMLAVSIVVAVAGMSWLGYLGYLTYRLSRKNERIEGLIAATYLEARRALEQHRP